VLHKDFIFDIYTESRRWFVEISIWGLDIWLIFAPYNANCKFSFFLYNNVFLAFQIEIMSGRNVKKSLSTAQIPIRTKPIEALWFM